LKVHSIARAADPFGQPLSPTGVELPGWDFAYLAVCLSVFSNALVCPPMVHLS